MCKIHVIEKNVPIPFKFYVPYVKQKSSEDGPLKLEFLASTTERSLTGHQMEESAIKDMQDQAVGLPALTHHNDEQVFGQIIEVNKQSYEEFRPIVQVFKESGNPVVDAPIIQVKQWLYENIPFGASIGGMIESLRIIIDEDDDTITFNIKHLRLIEMSATTIPALTSTKGEVNVINNSCKNGICQQLGLQIQQYIDSHKPLFKELYSKSVDETPTPMLVQKIVPKTVRGEKMDDKKIEEMLEKTNKSLNVLLQEREERIKQEQIELEKQKMEEQTTQMVDTILDGVSEKLPELVDKIVSEKLQTVIKDRTHVQSSQQIQENEIPEDVGSIVQEQIVKPGQPGENLIGQTFNDPANMPSHIGGIRQKEYTPTELVLKFAGA